MKKFASILPMRLTGLPGWSVGILLLLSGAPWPAAGEATAHDLTVMAPENWSRILLARAHDNERLGQKEDALVDYTLAIEKRALNQSDLARTLFDRGVLLDSMGRLGEASSDYSAALTLLPNFVAALNNRAGIYYRLGRLADARRDYLSAVDLGGPQSRFAYYGLGRIAEAQGDVAGARQFYGQALAADPKFDLAGERLTVLASGHPVAQAGGPMGGSAPLLVPQGSGKVVEKSSPVPRLATDLGVRTAPTGSEPGQADHRAQVQLGAWRTEQEAAQGWNQARERAGEALEGLSPRIMAVDLPGAGRFYRLRVASSQAGAKALCTILTAKGQDCIPAHE